MKKLFLFVVLLFCSATLFAQSDVTKFLGIPVDGTKAEMIQKLKAKGFHSIGYDSDILEGEFNGSDVYLSVITTNNKVSRVAVVEKYNTRSVSEIRTRFNNLCYQFQKNDKYLALQDEQSIPEDEDIRYNMAVDDKSYEAYFYQKVDSTIYKKEIRDFLLNEYPDIDKPNKTGLEKVDSLSKVIRYRLENVNRGYEKSVWFRINNKYGEYPIVIFYDNEYNRASGEDL